VPSVNEDSQTSRLEPTRWNHTKQPNTKRSSDHCISKAEAIDRIIKHRRIHQADTEAEQPDSIIHGSHLPERSDRFYNKAKPQPSSRKATVIAIEPLQKPTGTIADPRHNNQLVPKAKPSR
jgi:hypothetical protein